MKHLRKFNTEEEKTAWQSSEQYASPNVVFVKETGKVDYNLLIPGVSIQHIDGRLYTRSQWAENGFSNEEANGVAVVDEAASFVISKTLLEGGKVRWAGNTEVLVNGVMVATSEEEAITDYAGKANTELIALLGSGGAANACMDYVFPNGNKGYLPALGEWNVAEKYRGLINSAMSQIGGRNIDISGDMWSSTQSTERNAWLNYYNSDKKHSFYANAKSFEYYVRPFTTL